MQSNIGTMYRLAAVRVGTVGTSLSLRSRLSLRFSSGSPTAGNNPPEHFTKTGEKAQNPAAFNSRSYEYSQSGGDDIVAGQSSASFLDSKDTNPESEKATAGKGNVVNPLELSPATPELSKHFEETVISQSAEREPGAKTGQGLSRKAKTIKKTKIDFK
ncbi:hypothetical protein BKA66DRAFT_443232 [Pyrenochaeta sp. MPI-SDFR-AT-0127]|nr:hypothetical protein BKA66DRAFT_443232 [Pyrenochaeta sp. MPI-SDFR-AT-0127]